MEQIITLSIVLGVGFSLLTFLAKAQFNDIKTSIEKNNESTNKRIDKLENETNARIESLTQDLNNVKGDFATTFVLREDFFRMSSPFRHTSLTLSVRLRRKLVRLLVWM